MDQDADPRSARALLAALAAAAVLGLLGALAALALVGVVSAGQAVVWPDDLDPAAFSGGWRVVVIFTLAGFAVGLVHAIDRRAAEQNVFVALAGGGVDRRAIPGGLLIAVISLIGGFSLERHPLAASP